MKSLVAARELPAGHVLLEPDLAAKRPGDGLPPNRIGELLRRRLRRAVHADEAIAPEDVE
jgi:sialic acid synthase SpsE